MQIPASEQIEQAISSIPDLPDSQRKDQLKELNEVGSVRVQTIGATGMSTDLEVGYELGLQTARIMLLSEPRLLQVGIDPASLL